MCAASSVNVAATVRALEVSLQCIVFGACKLFTDAKITPDHPGITVVPIPRLTSSKAYSDFLLTDLVGGVETSHCLVAQWDGHVLDAARWDPAFLDYDYIGASWPQFSDGHDVGNGGFSLRSRRLMELCRDPGFASYHPEDVAIGRINREWLESKGMRFAPKALADLFSAERAGDVAKSFGYHGAWHMPSAIGVDAFWAVYAELDDRKTIRHDFRTLVKRLGRERNGWRQVLRLVLDQRLGRPWRRKSQLRAPIERDRTP